MHKSVMKSIVPFVLLCGFTIFGGTVRAQDVEPKYKTPDTNNAVIRGRVTLPSGFAAEGYARITLRNQQSVLSTIYTNNSGEFQIRNLSEGTYYVQAEVSGSFDPVTHKVELGRGLMVDLVLELRPKHDATLNRLGKVVSAAELRQQVPAAAKKTIRARFEVREQGQLSTGCHSLSGSGDDLS